MTRRGLGLQTATELTEQLRDREISSRELVDHYIQRGAKYNGDLNKIVTVDDEAARGCSRG